MGILCSKGDRYFSNSEALDDCKKSCINGVCPYKKDKPELKKPYYFSEPINNPTSKELDELEELFERPENNQQDTEIHLKKLLRLRFKNIRYYKF